MKTKNIKFKVCLWELVNPSRDSGLENPETKKYEYSIFAENETSAKEKAKIKFYREAMGGVYDSDVYPE